MFVSVTNCKSSSVEELAVNAKTNQALVKYNGSDNVYLYTGVEFANIYNLLYTEIKSIGQWVNNALKQDSEVSYITLWLVSYTLPSNFGWFSVIYFHTHLPNTLHPTSTQSGRFFIGDLGYTQPDNQVWRDKFVSQMFNDDKTSNEGVLTVDGYNFFVANTGGDGFFPVQIDGEHVGNLPVDSGCVGIIPMELVTEDEGNLEDKGLIIDLEDAEQFGIDFVPGDFFSWAEINVSLNWANQFDFN